MKSAKRSVSKKKSGKTASKSTVKKAPVKQSKLKPVKSTGTKAIVRKETKLSTFDKPYTKSQFITTLAERTQLGKKEVNNILDEIKAIIETHLKKGGPGIFTLPGLLKLTLKDKAATKARKGISPLTGEEIIFKAKPARKVVKIRPLQGLKSIV